MMPLEREGVMRVPNLDWLPDLYSDEVRDPDGREMPTETADWMRLEMANAWTCGTAPAAVSASPECNFAKAA
jgi:hypothetical protein